MGIRPIAQMQLSNIYGLEKTHQVTYPHISHEITHEEYSQLHSRANKRYQPTKKVALEPVVPPTWEGYEVPDHLRPQENKEEVSSGSTAGDTPERLKKSATPAENPIPTTTLNYYPNLGGLNFIPSPRGTYKPAYNIVPPHTKQERKLSDNLVLEPKNLLNAFEANETTPNTDLTSGLASEQTNMLQVN